MDKAFYVYILTNKLKSSLYIGVTNNLIQRIAQHRQKNSIAFTSRYHLTHLVYSEEFVDILSAIQREKQLKGWTRKKKECLITLRNPNWDHLLE